MATSTNEDLCGLEAEISMPQSPMSDDELLELVEQLRHQTPVWPQRPQSPMSFDGLFDDTWDMQSLLQLNDNAPGRIDNQDPLANGLEGDGASAPNPSKDSGEAVSDAPQFPGMDPEPTTSHPGPSTTNVQRETTEQEATPPASEVSREWNSDAISNQNDLLGTIMQLSGIATNNEDPPAPPVSEEPEQPQPGTSQSTPPSNPMESAEAIIQDQPTRSDAPTQANITQYPFFTGSENHLHKLKDDKMSQPLYSIKKEKLVKLHLSEDPISRPVLVGMFHSHPKFSKLLIRNEKDPNCPYPFTVGNKGYVSHFLVDMPSDAGMIPMYMAFVEMTDESKLDLTYQVISSPPKRMKDEKLYKENMKIVIMPSQDLIQRLFNHEGDGPVSLAKEDLADAMLLDVQIRGETAHARPLAKDHRKNKVSIPIPKKSMKRKAIEGINKLDPTNKIDADKIRRINLVLEEDT
jgi:hypothetical protein